MTLLIESVEFQPDQLVITYSESSDARFQQGTIAVRRQLLLERGRPDRPRQHDDFIERVLDSIKLLLRDALDVWERASPVVQVSPAGELVERQRLLDEEANDATARRNWEAIEAARRRTQAEGVDSGGAPAGS